MQKKLLVIAVLSFIGVSSALAQNADLKKVFNPNAVLSTLEKSNPIAVSGETIFEYDTQANAIFRWDTTVTTTFVDSLVLFPLSQGGLRNLDLETVGDDVISNINFPDGGIYLNYLSILNKATLLPESQISSIQFGKTSYFTFIRSISNTAFRFGKYSIDSLRKKRIGKRWLRRGKGNRYEWPSYNCC